MRDDSFRRIVSTHIFRRVRGGGGTDRDERPVTKPITDPVPCRRRYGQQHFPLYPCVAISMLSVILHFRETSKLRYAYKRNDENYRVDEDEKKYLCSRLLEFLSNALETGCCLSSVSRKGSLRVDSDRERRRTTGYPFSNNLYRTVLSDARHTEWSERRG